MMVGKHKFPMKTLPYFEFVEFEDIQNLDFKFPYTS